MNMENKAHKGSAQLVEGLRSGAYNSTLCCFMGHGSWVWGARLTTEGLAGPNQPGRVVQDSGLSKKKKKRRMGYAPEIG